MSISTHLPQMSRSSGPHESLADLGPNNPQTLSLRLSRVENALESLTHNLVPTLNDLVNRVNDLSIIISGLQSHAASSQTLQTCLDMLVHNQKEMKDTIRHLSIQLASSPRIVTDQLSAGQLATAQLTTDLSVPAQLQNQLSGQLPNQLFLRPSVPSQIQTSPNRPNPKAAQQNHTTTTTPTPSSRQRGRKRRHGQESSTPPRRDNVEQEVLDQSASEQSASEQSVADQNRPDETTEKAPDLNLPNNTQFSPSSPVHNHTHPAVMEPPTQTSVQASILDEFRIPLTTQLSQSVFAQSPQPTILASPLHVPYTQIPSTQGTSVYSSFEIPQIGPSENFASQHPHFQFVNYSSQRPSDLPREVSPTRIQTTSRPFSTQPEKRRVVF